MRVLDYIASETERQSGTVREGLGMYEAWRDWQDRKPGLVTEAMILDAVRKINGLTWYRSTPVTFRDGGHALNSTLIPRAMENLIEAMSTSSEHGADWITKEFLDIHPFADGNGRVGSILWNFLRGSINDPEPMPYFFGEA